MQKVLQTCQSWHCTAFLIAGKLASYKQGKLQIENEHAGCINSVHGSQGYNCMLAFAGEQLPTYVCAAGETGQEGLEKSIWEVILNSGVL